MGIDAGLFCTFAYMTGKYYRHFKGNVYRVLHIAKNSETLEDMVVYQAMYGEGGIWVRPKALPLHQVISFSVINYVVSMRCLT